MDTNTERRIAPIGGACVQADAAPRAIAVRIGAARWIVCGLLFFATTVNYIDRQVLSILKPTLQAEFGWREADYAWIVVAFQLAYALMMPIAGRLIDRLGTRIGYALAVLVWSAASMVHAFARTPGLGVTLNRDKLREYSELYKRLGNYPYDQDPARPGWTPLVPNDRWADPDDGRPVSFPH